MDGHIPPVDLGLILVSPIDLILEFIPRYVRRRLGIHDLRRRWRGSPDGLALLER